MRPQKIDQNMIVTEAIALLESDGLAAVSLRSIAKRLDVQAPSLYRHIRNKDELCSLMSARIFRACLDRIPEVEHWRDWLVSFGEVLWDEQNRSRGALELIAAYRQRGRATRQVPDQVIIALTSRGLDRVDAVVLQLGVQSLVTGWTMMSARSDVQDRARFLTMLRSMVKGWDTIASNDGASP